MENELVKIALESDKASEFLLNLKKSKGLSYEQLARKGKFKSKSQVFDILNRKKAITQISFEKLLKAFGLRNEFEDLLSCLVSKERALQLNSEDQLIEINKNLVQIHKKINISYKKSKDLDLSKDLFLKAPHFLQILSSIPFKGTTIDEIHKATGISASRLREQVSFLSKHSVIKMEQKSIYSSNLIWMSHLPLGRNGFKHFLLDTQYRNINVIRRLTIKEEDNTLFTSMCFSVKESNIKELKTRLSKVIRQFMIENEEEDFDCVVNLNLSFFMESILHK